MTVFLLRTETVRGITVPFLIGLDVYGNFNSFAYFVIIRWRIVFHVIMVPSVIRDIVCNDLDLTAFDIRVSAGPLLHHSAYQEAG